MPTPYLLSVHSHPKPSKLSTQTWIQWYLEEHIRDMVYFGASKTGAFYTAASEIFTSNSPPKDGSESMDFLTLYQTDRKAVTESVEVREKVRKTSSMWKEEGCEGLTSFDVGDFVITEGVLIEILGNYEYNEGTHATIITITSQAGSFIDASSRRRATDHLRKDGGRGSRRQARFRTR